MYDQQKLPAHIEEVLNTAMDEITSNDSTTSADGLVRFWISLDMIADDCDGEGFLAVQPLTELKRAMDVILREKNFEGALFIKPVYLCELPTVSDRKIALGRAKHYNDTVAYNIVLQLVDRWIRVSGFITNTTKTLLGREHLPIGRAYWDEWKKGDALGFITRAANDID